MCGICLHEPLDGHIEGIDLVHLLQRPHAFLAVPPHKCALMAGLAQGHAGVLAVLLDVVGIRWPGFVADTAGQFLDPGKVQPLLGVQFVVHWYTMNDPGWLVGAMVLHTSTTCLHC